MKRLKRDYNSTMVSMTDKYGKTGNVDYRDCHEPIDAELVIAARRYQLSERVKFTITNVVGVKTRFIADVVGNALVNKTEVVQDTSVLKRACEALYAEEVAKLSEYMDSDFCTSECLSKVGVTAEEIWDIVNTKRKDIWKGLSDEYTQAMFNYTIVEVALKRVSDGSIQW